MEMNGHYGNDFEPKWEIEGCVAISGHSGKSGNISWCPTLEEFEPKWKVEPAACVRLQRDNLFP